MTSEETDRLFQSLIPDLLSQCDSHLLNISDLYRWSGGHFLKKGETERELNRGAAVIIMRNFNAKGPKTQRFSSVGVEIEKAAKELNLYPHPCFFFLIALSMQHWRPGQAFMFFSKVRVDVDCLP
jgi:hypothetical protein